MGDPLDGDWSRARCVRCRRHAAYLQERLPCDGCVYARHRNRDDGRSDPVDCFRHFQGFTRIYHACNCWSHYRRGYLQRRSEPDRLGRIDGENRHSYASKPHPCLGAHVRHSQNVGVPCSGYRNRLPLPRESGWYGRSFVRRSSPQISCHLNTVHELQLGDSRHDRRHNRRPSLAHEWPRQFSARIERRPKDRCTCPGGRSRHGSPANSAPCLLPRGHIWG